MASSVAQGGGTLGLAARGLQAAGSSGLGALAENAFGQMAQKFGEAGVSFLQSLSRVFVESSTVDLGAAGIDPVLAITMPIAMLVAVLLVVTAAGKTALTGNRTCGPDQDRAGDHPVGRGDADGAEGV